MTSRERFEQWAKEANKSAREYDRFKSGVYVSPLMQIRWEAWQAAESAAVRRCAEIADSNWQIEAKIRKEFPGAFE